MAAGRFRCVLPRGRRSGPGGRPSRTSPGRPPNQAMTAFGAKPELINARISGARTNIQINEDKTRVSTGGGDSRADGSAEGDVRVREKRMTAFPARHPTHG